VGIFPFGMLRRHRLHAIENEGNMEIEWLLAPQGSVFIEDRDPFFGFDEGGLGTGVSGRNYPQVRPMVGQTLERFLPTNGRRQL